MKEYNITCPMHVLHTYEVVYTFRRDGLLFSLNITGPYDEIRTKDFTDEEWDKIEDAIIRIQKDMRLGTIIDVIGKRFVITDLSFNEIYGGAIRLSEIVAK